MELIIDDKNNIGLKDFCYWLIKKMQNYILTNIDERQLIRFDAYLNNNNIIIPMDNLNRFINTRNILIGSAYNLRVIDNTNEYKIEINPNINIPNTYAKFIDIVKLINYGNTELNKYPIYDDMINYFADNIEEYYITYIEEQEGN